MSLGEEDRQAFFRLMDEYFASRPHLFQNFQPPSAAGAQPAPASAKKAPPPPPRQASGGGNMLSAPVEALASTMQQTKVSEPASGPRVPEGLSRGKVRGIHSPQGIGKIDTTSTQSVLASSVGLATHKVLDKAKTQFDNYTSRDSNETAAPPAAPSESIEPPPQRGTAGQAPEAAPGGLGEAVALYPFTGSQVGDLTVEQGERITLLEQVTPDWFRARSADGTREGIVPANYIQRS
ncbi:hypothetical protein MCAP1_002327 [Malassezia caprae]|uniref:SH3 domain-containing protein n=1 Tax=Malassezia caprae TaxID=1381934 RepID=A0AAF0E6S5_9BASI|nr:hypothetical protein MCAP1_002327 [Malassezia caprae]